MIFELATSNTALHDDGETGVNVSVCIYVSLWFRYRHAHMYVSKQKMVLRSVGGGERERGKKIIKNLSPGGKTEEEKCRRESCI